jgi:hypothetical protein
MFQFDGVHVVSGSLDTSIRVWDVETGACLHTLIGHQSLTSGLELKDNILVSGNADSTVKVWDITTGQCLQTLQGQWLVIFSASKYGPSRTASAVSFSTRKAVSQQMINNPCPQDCWNKFMSFLLLLLFCWFFFTCIDECMRFVEMASRSFFHSLIIIK